MYKFIRLQRTRKPPCSVLPIKTATLFLAIGSIFLATTTLAQAGPQDMVSCWKFDEGNGSTAYDSVGTNDGSITGATYTTGRVGGALQFDGWHYVAIPNDASLNPSNITIEAWVFPDNYGYYRAVVTKPYSGSWVNPYYSYQFTPLSNNTQQAAFTVTVGGTRYHVVTPADVLTPIGAWSHFVSTYDGQESRIYLNGELAVATTVTGPIDTRTTPLYIGTPNVPGNNNVFYGKIDEVAIYNRALTPEEAQQSYQNGIAGLGCAPDTDGDGVLDASDNCLEVANAAQRDTDADGIGNICDPDVAPPNDCTVNFLDLNVYKANFFAAGDFDTDNNGDGQTNFLDLNVVKSFFFGPPGPSASGCN